MKKIIFSNSGCASTDGETIKINKVFLNAPKGVLGELLVHEMKHSSGEYSLHDLLIDLQPRSLKFYLFCLLHPSTWSAFSPIQRNLRGSLEVDWGCVATYLLLFFLMLFFCLLF